MSNELISKIAERLTLRKALSTALSVIIALLVTAIQVENFNLASQFSTYFWQLLAAYIFVVLGEWIKKFASWKASLNEARQKQSELTRAKALAGPTLTLDPTRSRAPQITGSPVPEPG